MVGEVSDEIQAPAKCLDVAGDGLDGRQLAALDLGNPARGNTYGLGELSLGEAAPLTLVGEPLPALPGHSGLAAPFGFLGAADELDLGVAVPAKEALLAAVIASRLDDLAERAARLGSDPQEDFFAFLAELVDSGRDNLALAAALGGLPNGLIQESAGRLSAALKALLEAAQRTGGVRPDVDVAEVHAIITGVLATESRLPAGRRGLGLEIAIRGLRATPSE